MISGSILGIYDYSTVNSCSPPLTVGVPPQSPFLRENIIFCLNLPPGCIGHCVIY
jgi:hypothetical protein